MAKGYGILAVFAGHLVEGTVIGDFVYSFHLPLFFFLSGYLFRSDMPFFAFLKKKAKSILLPYFILGLPVVFFSTYYPLVFGGFKVKWFINPAVLWDAFLDSLLQFVIQIRYATLWYLAVLFGINIVMYVICRVKSELFGFIIAAAMLVFGLNYYASGGAALPWNVDVILTAIPFFFVGYFFSRHDFLYGMLLQLKWYLKLVIWAAFMALNIYANGRTFKVSGEGLEMYWNHYGAPAWTYLSAFAGIFAVIVFSSLFSLRPISYIGEHSMLFFLWHQAIFFELWKQMYPKWGVPDIWKYIYAVKEPFRLYGGLTLLMLAQIIPTLIIIAILIELLRRTPLRRMV